MSDPQITPIPQKTEYRGSDEKQHNFFFVCEGCGSAGELGLIRKYEHKPFGCPEGCGATYIAWRPSPDGPMELKCVVCPVFESEKSAQSVDEDL